MAHRVFFVRDLYEILYLSMSGKKEEIHIM